MFHEAVIAGLSCPRCPEVNGRRGGLIELVNDELKRAFCNGCSYEGPLEEFQKEGKP